MTLQEFIEHLQKHELNDPNMEVVLSDGMLLQNEAIYERYIYVKDGKLIIGPA